MRRTSTWLLALALALSGCGSASSPTAPDVTEPVSQTPESSLSIGPGARSQEFPYGRILCFGDSLTYGVTLRALSDGLTLTPVEGFVPKLTRRLVLRYPKASFEIINSGIGGESTDLGRVRLSADLDRFRPDLVLLLEGTVDAGNRNPSFRRIRRDLFAMMRDVTSRGIDLVVGTIPPFHADGFRATGIDNVATVNQIIREEAELVGAILADHEIAFGVDPGLQGPDGVHPNAMGYEVMADTWMAAITALLARSGT